MVQFLRDLLAAPFRVLAFLFGHVPVFNPLAFYRIVWRLSGDSDTGREMLIRTHEHKGLEAAESLAEILMAERPDAMIALVIGGINLYKAADATRAQGWIDKARSLKCRDEALLLWLEAAISDFIQPKRLERILDAILSRNDLPGAYTQMALFRQAELCLRNQEWDKAEAICDRICKIDKAAAAEWYYYVVDVARRYHEDEAILSRIFDKVDGHKHYLRNHAIFCWYLGAYNQSLNSLKLAYDNGITEVEIRNFNPAFARFIASLEDKGEAVWNCCSGCFCCRA